MSHRAPAPASDAAGDSPVEARIRELGPWFHNMTIGGVQTAPDHFLGDYPSVKWRRFAHAIPADLTGCTVLDIGCNAGFYSLEMKRRGADRVVGIDWDEAYLAQARFATEANEAEIEFRQMSVYDVAALGEQFDIVLFMGVLYHLRHPLLALDLLYEHVVGDLLVFQSMLRGSAEVAEVAPDYAFAEQAVFEDPAFPRMHFIERKYSGDPTNWWVPNRSAMEAMLRSAGFVITDHPEPEVFICRRGPAPTHGGAVYPREEVGRVVEAVMLWNEPNNLSHWNFEIDRGWTRFAEMVRLAAAAIRREHPTLPRVLGGISPIDPAFMILMKAQGVLDHVEVVAVHGFPLDWNHWQIDDWPDKLDEIRTVTERPIWVSEVGVSTFGAEEVQEFGLRRTAELLVGPVERIHWYSLYDLPRAWPATTRHREAEGSSYYRHFYMGLLREDGTPKRAMALFPALAPAIGICQWFHFEDHRLDEAVAWLKRIGVRHLRTGLSWADSLRPNADAWFDRQMAALADFDVTLTFCFTPESQSEGVEPHHTSPPRDPHAFAEFCARMVRRYAPAPALDAVSLQQG